MKTAKETAKEISQQTSETAKEIALISKPGSVEEAARQRAFNDISKAIGPGATSGATEALAESNSFLGYFFVDKSRKQ